MKRIATEREQELKELLLNHKRQLWNEVRKEYFGKLGEDHHAQYETPLDVGDQGLADLIEDVGLSVADIHRQELTLIDDVIRRLEAGTYGACDDCGREIEVERLRLVPYTRYCVPCQEVREGPAYPPTAKY
jgi:RNA polymerase-binding transcription factor